MTIEYKESKRIVALSTDTVETITLDEDFSSYTTQSAADASWVPEDTAESRVNITDDDIDFTYGATTNTRIYHDLQNELGSGVFLGTKFVLRGKFRWSVLTLGVDNDRMFFGVGSGTGDKGQADSIQMEYRQTNPLLRISYGAGSLSSSTSITSLSTSTDYYWEIIRDGTSVTATIYTDSNYNTVHGTVTGTITSQSNLRYVKLMSNTTSAQGAFTGTLDDVKVWNNVTSISSRPTDVQDNSILVEKDTTRRYWFDKQTGTTPTYNDNFSTYDDQTAADAAWVSNDNADFRVNITNDNLDFNSKVTSTTNTGIYYDLGTALSDTAWTMDFKLVITTNTLYSSGSVNAATYITMNDTNNGGAIGGNVDAMGFYISSPAAGSKFCVTWANSSYLNRGGGEFSGTITTGTFYMRLKRTGATSVKLEVYSEATRTSSSLIEEKEITGTDSGITGLQYIRIQDNQSSAGTGSGQTIGTIDDICIYDGVTSATAPFSPATWNMQPTYDTDFSSSTGWTTSNSSKVDIDTSANELQIKENGGTLAQMYYDLGSDVSTTKWVIRCRIMLNGSANTDEPLFKFELNDTANASSNTNSDSLGFYVYTDRNNTWSRIYQVCKDSTTSVLGVSSSPQYYGDISSSTYYYITLTRSSATDFEVKIRTGSHSGTVLGTLTQSSIPSGLTGLRYLTAQNYLQGQGQTMDISEVEFYNGVTSIN